ncbi:MAG: glycosyltransferase family 4 protein [Planctomycetes bacterium]|nr:glycosyltransferase family 4 protein [Planctomycetota bacterium]
MQTVVYVSATDELGGADASLFELVQALDRSRFRAHVVVPHVGPYAARYRTLGVPVHVVPLRKLKNTKNLLWHLRYLAAAPLRVLRLLQLFRRLRPAVIHVNTSVEALAGLAAAWHCKWRGGRLVWHVRELELRPRIVERTLFALVRRLADTVVAISSPVAARFGRRERVYVIPNGIDLQRFTPADKPRPADRPPTLGWVGRIAKGKGLDHVLETFALVRQKLPQTQLLVMGAPVPGHETYAARLRERAQAIGGVTFVPAGPDPERVYAELDLFVHLPDLAEGLGRTVLEAAAAGVPTVAWPQGGLVDTIQDQTTGVFTPSHDLPTTAGAIVALLEDPARRTAMSHAAAAFARERFDRARCARAVETTYQGAMP